MKTTVTIEVKVDVACIITALTSALILIASIL